MYGSICGREVEAIVRQISKEGVGIHWIVIHIYRRRPRNGNVRRGLDAERDLFGEAFAGADQREGMAAFVEKRKAVFTGE